MLPTKFRWQPCLITDRDKMSNLHRGHSIDASYQVSLHLAKRFQRRRIYRNQPIRNKNCLWRPLLTDREEMCNIYRGPLIDASYQVSVHLARRFQRKRIFRNQPIRKYNCLWLPCLLTDRDKCAFFQRTFHRCFLPSLVHLVKQFQRRIFFQKSTNHKQELPVAAMFINDREEMCNLNRGPSIDPSTKFSFIWPSSLKGEDFQKSTNLKQ